MNRTCSIGRFAGLLAEPALAMRSPELPHLAEVAMEGQ
jgi:hypothetical protein